MTSIHSGSNFHTSQRLNAQHQYSVRTQFGNQIRFGADSSSDSDNSQPATAEPKTTWEKVQHWFKSLFNQSEKEGSESNNKAKRKQDLSVSRGIWRTLATLAPTSPRAIVEWIAIFHGVGIVFPIKHFMEGLTGYNSIAIPRVWGRKIWSSRVGRNHDIGERKTLLWHGLIGRNLFKKAESK